MSENDIMLSKSMTDDQYQRIIKDSYDDSTLGIKHDAEKLQWSLLPIEPMEDVIKALMHGAKEYAPNNWMYVKPVERYLDAAMRHLTARIKGEILDSESGLPHLAHMICCGLFAIWHDNRKEESE